MLKNKYVRLIADMAIFSIGTVLTKAVQFFLMPLYTTFMTTETYGIAELTNNLSELLFPIVTLCVYEAAFRYIINSKFKPEEILTASLKVLLSSAILGMLILLVAHFIYQYRYAEYLYLIVYAYSIRMLMAYYVRGKGYAKLFATSGVVNAIFLAFFNYLFLVLLHYNVEGYLLAIALSYICSMLYLFIGGKLYLDIKWKVPTKEVISELLNYSYPLIFYNIGYWITTMLGRYILLWRMDASTAGIYAAIIKITAVINMFQQAFYAALQLNTSREYESKEKETYFSNIFSLYTTGILISGSIMLCMSPVLAKLTLKNEFYAARIYLPLVMFTAIFDCIFCFFKTMYTTYKQTKRAVPSMMVGAVVNIIVTLILVDKIAIWGICVSSLFCYISQAIYRIIDVRKFIILKCNWKMIGIYLSILSVQVILLSFYKTFYWILAIILAIGMGISIIYLYRKDLRKIIASLQNIK